LTSALLGTSRDVFVGIACGAVIFASPFLYSSLRHRYSGQAAFAVTSAIVLVAAIAISWVAGVFGDIKPIVVIDRAGDATAPSADANGSHGSTGASGPSGASGPTGSSGATGLARGPDEPDEDGDGLADPVPLPRTTGIRALLEDRRTNELGAYVEDIVVGGISDVHGVLMEVDGPSDAFFAIAANREFQTLRGRVGISSDPCSSGSRAGVAVRDGSGRTLWPRRGGLEPIDKDAQPFEVSVAGEDEVVLYAQAPETARTYCGSGATIVGWVKARLISAE
jgi:hypothetical protein